MRNFLLGLFSGVTLLILLLLAGVIALGMKAISGARPETPNQMVLRLSWSDVLVGHQVSPLDAGLHGTLTLTSLIETLDRAAEDSPRAGRCHRWFCAHAARVPLGASTCDESSARGGQAH